MLIPIQLLSHDKHIKQYDNIYTVCRHPVLAATRVCVDWQGVTQECMYFTDTVKPEMLAAITVQCIENMTIILFAG